MSWEIEKQIKAQHQQTQDLMIATPTRDGKVTQHFHLAAMQLQNPFANSTAYSMEVGQPIDISRNIAVARAQQINAKYLLFWDGDTRPPAHALKTLVDLHLPAVGCVYKSRGPPYSLLAIKDRKPLEDSFLEGDIKVVEVDQMGLGFFLIDMRVFDRYGQKLDHFQCLADHTDITGQFMAAFDYKTAKANNYKCSVCKGAVLGRFFDYRAGKNTRLPYSEDYYFQAKIKEMGFRTFACSIFCIHENPYCSVDRNGLTTSLGSASDLR